MRILISSDQHWHCWTEFDKLTSDGKSFRLSLYEKTHEYIRDYCKKNDILHWIDAGDIFHSREGISSPVLDALGKQLHQSKDVGIKMYFLKGNHDIHNRVGNITSLNILSQYGKVINEQQVYNLTTQFPGGCTMESVKINFIPWDENINFTNVINKCEKTNIVVAHRMIKGAELHGTILDGESIKGLDCQKFDMAFIGHVHERQYINGKMMYIGNLVNSNFGEKERGGFLVYDTIEKTTEEIQNPFSPLFIKKDIYKISDITNCETNAFYDFKILSNSTEETEEITKKLSELKDKANGIRISITKHIVAENRIDNSLTLTPENLLNQYAKINDLNEDILNIGKQILKECKSV